ncbi:MAG: sigma 54-interacting transcriptional regulator [Oligoflexia bacterium]|nr:sigma 54-interacting transcriptional regulator [Oligoflexia bacterium]
MSQTQGQLFVSLIGSPDFCRRLQPMLPTKQFKLKVSASTLAEAWGSFLAARPDIAILEIGFYHTDRQQAALRRLLAQVRERLGNQVYIVIALMAPEKLFFGGDLLFLDEESLKPSLFVDSFVVLPPGNLPSTSDIPSQLENMCQLVELEWERRADGKVALPALGASGWVQSLADPQSRELWMRWLPRYASYTNENPIIIGRTGTGKTNLAYALHLLSGRPGQFVSITPRDFSSSELVQAELFGAVAGAYTGAVDKWGLVKKAEKGTLFIDELQSIDKELQGKLITFIENKVYRRVGSAESIEADVRFVFASNRKLHDMMESNVLRDDFAYRLERVQLELADLSERRLDITAAVGYALAKIYRQRPHARRIEGVTAEAYRLLFCHRWPGNLRQLENNTAQLCERADMHKLRCIDEAIVREILESRLSGAAFSGPEVLAEAAIHLAQRILRESVSGLEQGEQIFAECARTSALNSRGGDIEKASQLISDDKRSLELFVIGQKAKAKRDPSSNEGAA